MQRDTDHGCSAARGRPRSRMRGTELRSVHIYSTRAAIGALAVAGLVVGWGPRAAQRDPWPFTPEVEEFIKIYVDAGGEKLTNWVGEEKTRPPADTLRAFEPIGGLAVDLVASEPVIRQPIDLHFDDRGRLWVVQYL